MPLPPLKPGRPSAQSHEARVAERLASLERRVREFEVFFSGGSTQNIPLVQSLPTAGRAGRLVQLATDLNVYKDTGSAWVSIG